MRVSHVLATYPLATPRCASGAANTYPLSFSLSLTLKSPYHITCCRAFLCCWPAAKFLIFAASCQSRCQFANRVANEPHDTFISIFIFISHLPQHKENFYTFLLKFFLSLSALYKFVSGSSDSDDADDDDVDMRDSCQLSSAKILTVIMRHMQITLPGA